MIPGGADFLFAFLLGVVVGAAQLVPRFKSSPLTAVLTFPGLAYLLINGGASALALALLHVLGVQFGASGDKARWLQVFAAGAGALALFRTALTVRTGSGSVSIGFADAVEALLVSASGAVDRTEAANRSDRTTQIMSTVSFAKASVVLPPYCIALMQNVSVDDQTKLGADVRNLTVLKGPSDAVKARLLGLMLMNIVGPDALSAAVQGLGDEISEPGRDVRKMPARRRWWRLGRKPRG